MKNKTAIDFLSEKYPISIEDYELATEIFKEQILNAYNSCYSKNPYTGEFIVTIEDYESANRFWNDKYETNIIKELKQSTLF